jgi:hypothetical protein
MDVKRLSVRRYVMDRKLSTRRYVMNRKTFVMITVGTLLLCASVQAEIMTLFTNGMETVAAFSGGTRVDTMAYTGTWSEEFPADSAWHDSSPNKWLPLPEGLTAGQSIINAHYDVYLNDNDNSSQIYRKYARFAKNVGGADASGYYDSGYHGIGSGWENLSWDMGDLINTRMSEGYTHMSIHLLAYNGSSYVPYYADDLWIWYEIETPTPAGTLIVIQ